MNSIIISGIIGFIGGLFLGCVLKVDKIQEMESDLARERANNMKLERLYHELKNEKIISEGKKITLTDEEIDKFEVGE